MYRLRTFTVRRSERGHPGKRWLRLEQLEARCFLSASGVPELPVDWRSITFAIDRGGLAESSDFDPLHFLTDGFALADPSQTLIHSVATRQQFGLSGGGYSVAILDTGMDYRHPSLATNYIGGWDFVDNDADPFDLQGHGTHVAGIIGSSSSQYPGVAPGVKLISLRVLDQNGSGNFGDVYEALQWVVNHRSQYNIVAVNMSLGSGNYQVNPFPYLEGPLKALDSQGVFVAAASGNSFYSFGSQPGVDYPAISPYVVSVGAVWSGNFGRVSWGSGAVDYATAADRVTSFTQRGPMLDILAPGAFVTSTYPGGGFRTLAGTSMASPIVAGASVLLREEIDDLGLGPLANRRGILSIMQQTGLTVMDGDDEQDNVRNTGLSFARLDLLSALNSLTASTQTAPVSDAVGWFAPATNTFYFKRSNAAGVADGSRQFGASGSGWTPLAGDWDGNQTDTVGLFDPATSTFYLSNSSNGGANLVLQFGPAGVGWTPLVGDWNGDGRDSVGLFDRSTGTVYLKDSLSAGAADTVFQFGPAGAGWQPIIGDWDGNRTDTIGLLDPVTSTFYLRNSSSAGAADVTFQFGPAGAGWTPIAGDWQGRGADAVGFFNASTGTFYLKNTFGPGTADSTFLVSPTRIGAAPLVGRWSLGAAFGSQSGQGGVLQSLYARQSDQDLSSAPFYANVLHIHSAEANPLDGASSTTRLIEQLPIIRFAGSDIDFDQRTSERADDEELIDLLARHRARGVQRGSREAFAASLDETPGNLADSGELPRLSLRR